jgi:hypothetical protein
VPKARRQTSIVSVVAILILAPALACAKDYCLLPAPTYGLRGQGFTIPKKGQCTRWNGFTTIQGENGPALGTACTASNGSKLSLTITSGFDSIFIDSMTLSLPSLNGTDYTSILGGSGAPIISTVAGGLCPKILHRR